jgi:hypothetical protein
MDGRVFCIISMKAERMEFITEEVIFINTYDVDWNCTFQNPRRGREARECAMAAHVINPPIVAVAAAPKTQLGKSQIIHVARPSRPTPAACVLFDSRSICLFATVVAFATC